MRRAIAAFLAIIVLCFGIALASASGDSSRSAPIHARAEQAPNVEPANDPGAQLLKAQAVVDYGHFLDRQAVANLIVATQISEIVDYVAAVEQAQWIAARDALGRYLAAVASRPVYRAPAPQYVAPAPAPSSSGGSCYGGVVPDSIVNRESGGDPNALNPSGAFGCFQIMPEWWGKSGPDGCAQFSRDVAGQKACAEVIMRTQGASAWAL